MDQSDLVGSIHHHRISKKNKDQCLWFFDCWDKCHIKGAQLCSSPISMWGLKWALKHSRTQKIILSKKRRERAKACTSPNYQRLILMSIDWRSKVFKCFPITLYLNNKKRKTKWRVYSQVNPCEELQEANRHSWKLGGTHCHTSSTDEQPPSCATSNTYALWGNLYWIHLFETLVPVGDTGCRP